MGFSFLSPLPSSVPRTMVPLFAVLFDLAVGAVRAFPPDRLTIIFHVRHWHMSYVLTSTLTGIFSQHQLGTSVCILSYHLFCRSIVS